MNGAELILKTVRMNGIDVCFANAGTTEIPLVAALDGEPGIRTVLGLFEGVCTGAADGYGRVLDRPAMALLHLGPGFANGVACLHNARRAGAPVVNIIGEHASWHRDADPPLHMDIWSLAGTVSGWRRTSGDAFGLSRDVAEAIGVAMSGKIASLIVHNDHQLADCGQAPVEKAVSYVKPVDLSFVEEAERVLKSGVRTAMILGGRALRREGLMMAARIREATGCDLLANSFPGYMDRGGSLPVVARIPYFPEPAMELIGGYDAFVIAGAHDPVTFFGYQGVPGHLIGEGKKKVVIAAEDGDAPGALEHLSGVFAKAQGWRDPAVNSAGGLSVPGGPLTPENISWTIAALQPEDAIIVDEGLTTSFPYYPASHGLASHGYMTIAGGAIGYGMPCAVGAAFAAPEAPVICIQADGSAMYTVQALWTMAREGLDVTVFLCSNGGYHVIDVELERAGLKEPGRSARKLVNIDSPVIDWVSLAGGLGVPAVCVEDTGGLAAEMKRAMAEAGPHLIEMVVKKA